MIIPSTVASKMIIVLRTMKRMILKISPAHFNSCSRVVISNDNDISRDDHSINQEERWIRSDQTNSRYYKNRKGCICVLCKWGIVPCCSPNICKKHHLRFNECVETKGQ